jgi:hypothetical protein
LGKNIREPKEEQQNTLFGMCFPKEIILLFFFRLADVFPQKDHFAVLL